MEEQQSALLELVDQLQKRLGGPTVAEVPRPAQPLSPAETAEASLQLTTAAQVSWPSASAAPLTQPSSPAKAAGGLSAADDGTAAAIRFRTTGD